MLNDWLHKQPLWALEKLADDTQQYILLKGSDLHAFSQLLAIKAILSERAVAEFRQSMAEPDTNSSQALLFAGIFCWGLAIALIAFWSTFG